MLRERDLTWISRTACDWLSARIELSPNQRRWGPQCRALYHKGSIVAEFDMPPCTSTLVNLALRRGAEQTQDRFLMAPKFLHSSTASCSDLLPQNTLAPPRRAYRTRDPGHRRQREMIHSYVYAGLVVDSKETHRNPRRRAGPCRRKLRVSRHHGQGTILVVVGR